MRTMPAQPVSLAWSGGTAALDERAAVLLRLDAADAAVKVALAPDPGLLPVLVEDDLAEHEGALGSVEVMQRVTAAEHCQLRWVVGAGDEPAAAPELEISVPDGFHAWLWPSGADGLLAVVPEAGAGPVLVLHAVQAGLWAAGEAADGRTLRLALAPEPLAAGDRRVVVLRAVALPDLAAAAALLPSWYEPLTLAAGEDWVAPLADLGVDCAPPVEVQYPDVDDTVRVVAPSGRHRIGVHGRRGVTELLLEVAPVPGELLGQAAERLLAGGSLDAAAAVVVHRALEAGHLPRRAAVEDALDRFDWTSRGEPLAVAFGSERALAEGEQEMAREAVRQLAGMPGGGQTARIRSLVWFAASALGVDTSALAIELPDRAPVLEDELLLGHRTAASVAGLEGSINRLGAALPGHPVGLGFTEQAQLVGLLESCPEDWPESPLAGTTAEAARQRILAGYAAGDLLDPVPLAWLLLSG
ncbi:MAG: hypothetical protein AAGC63_00255 [Propionicimonas sp.]|nr:hypothetical protein [Propionicimonas sp.]